jgi:hypothetical protein
VQTDYRLVIPPTGFPGPDQTYDWGPDYLLRFAPYIPAAGDILNFKYCYIDLAGGVVSVSSNVAIKLPALPGPLIPLEFCEGAAGTATITTAGPHGMIATQVATIAGCSEAGYDGPQTILTTPAPNQFTFASATAIGLQVSAGTAQRTA